MKHLLGDLGLLLLLIGAVIVAVTLANKNNHN